jgi:hypothetical protein
VLHTVNEARNFLHAIRRRKDNWIGDILRRNYLLKHVVGRIAGGLEVTRRQGRRREQLLDGLKETRGYWKLKEEALDYSVCRTGCGRVSCLVVRQATK